MKTQFNLHQGRNKIALRLLSFALAVVLIFGQRTSVISAFAGTEPDGEIVYDKTYTPGREAPDGENPDGENPDGENPGGENPDGETPNGENPDGENPDGENPDGETPDGETPDGETPEVAPATEITLQLEGEIQDFSGIRVILAQADGTELEQTAVDADGAADFVLPADGDAFRLFISGMTDDLEIVEQGWKLDGGIYSKEFSREALENNGLINVAVTKAVVVPETFTITLKITEKIAGVMSGLARGLGDWLTGGNDNVIGLDVQVFECDANGNRTSNDVVGTGITVADGLAGSAVITFNEGYAIVPEQNYLVHISGMSSTFVVQDAYGKWKLDGIGYSKVFSGKTLKDDSNCLAGIELVARDSKDTYALSATSYYQISNAQVPTDFILETYDRSGNFLDRVRVNNQTGASWNVIAEYTYKLSFVAPAKGDFMHQSGYTNIASVCDSLPDNFKYEGAEIDADGRYVYTIFIDFKDANLQGRVITATFAQNKMPIDITKTYNEYTPTHPAYIGIASSTDKSNVDWEEIVSDKVSFEKEFFKEPFKDPDKKTLLGKYFPYVTTNDQQSYVLYEYIPADCAPIGNGWRLETDLSKYKLPDGEPGIKYSLYVFDGAGSRFILYSSRTAAITNGQAELNFGFGDDLSSDLNGQWNYSTVTAPPRSWRIEKVALNPTVTLTDRGEPYDVKYRTTFTKLDTGGEPKAKLVFPNATVVLTYDSLAISGDNQAVGTLSLKKYKTNPNAPITVTSKKFSANLSSGSDIGGGMKAIYFSADFEDPDYEQGWSYYLEFNGGFYYSVNGNPDLGENSKDFRPQNRRSEAHLINDIPTPVEDGDFYDTMIRDFVDELNNISEGNYSVTGIDDITFEGSTRNTQLTTDKDGKTNGFKLNGSLTTGMPPRIVVEYTVHFKDQSESKTTPLSPCTDGYKILNTASGVKSNSGVKISASAEVTVKIPTYATINVEKFDQNDKGESGVTFTLRDKVSGDILGSATTDANGKGTIMSVADSTKALRKWNPDGTERYILEVTIPYPDYPPFSKGADGELVKWTKVDVDGYKWSREISFRQQSSTDPYPNKYCGATTITVYDKSDTELTITKTGRGITEATFYLFDSSGKVFLNQSWKFNSVTEAAAGRVIKNLAPGSYTLYELVTKGFSPQGDGWEKVNAPYPTGITVGTTQELYKKTVTVGGGKSSAEVVNGEWQKLKITKTATGLHSASEKFKFKVFNEAGVVQKFTKKAEPAVDTYVFDPSGLVTELELELKTVDDIGKSITIEKLEPGKYTVEEIIPVNGTTPLYTVTGDNPESVTIGADTGVTSVIVPATFENNLVTSGEITVKKAVDGGTIDSESFTFTVTKKIGGAAPGVVHQLTGSNIAFDSTSGSISNGTAGQFTLKAGVTATLKNLTPGDVYIITEASTNDKFTTSHTIKVGTGAAEQGTGSVTREIPVTGGDTAVVFTNERIGDAKLYVSKVVPSTTFIAADENPVFTLQVSGLFKETKDGVVSIVQGTREILFAKNAGNVGGKTVYAWNTSVLVPDVINGCEYTVTEIGDALTKYTPSYNPADRKATAGIGSTATVTVTNANKGGGVLTIEKALAGSTENTRPFTVYLRNGTNPLYFTKSASGNTYTYSPTATGGASRDITISVDQKAIINGLPLGMVITVEEQGLAGTGYTAAYSDNDYTMSGDKTITVTNKATPVLTVKKTVENPQLVGPDKFKITVTNADTGFKWETTFGEGAEHPFAEEVKVDGVQAGVTYTITETAEDGTTLAYYTTTVSGLTNVATGNRQGEVTVLATNTATAPAKVVFNNKRESGGGLLKVKKVVSDVDSESGKEIFVVTVTGEFSDGDTSKTAYFSKTVLSSADKASHVSNAIYALWGEEALIPNVILGYTYNVSETNVIGGALDNYNVLVTNNGSIKIPVGSVTAVVTNTREDSATGTMIIEKTLKTGSQEDTTGFTVNIKNANTDALLNFTNTGNDYTLAKSGGSPKITVSKAGGPVTVTGLLLNVPLKVVEVDSTGKEVTEYNVTYTGFDADGNVTLTNANNSRNVAIDNDGTKGTELYVTKEMGNSIDAGTDQFTIEVTGFFAGETVEKTLPFTFGKTASETPKKVYKFEELVEVTGVTGVIGGNTYTITEINSDGAVLGKYTTTVAATAGAVWTDDATGRGGSLALKPGQKLTVTVTNTRKTDGELTVTKTVNGGVWNTTDKFTFTLLNEDGTPAANITGTPDGTFTLTGVTGGNSIKFTNLTVGAKYTVEEKDPGKNYEFVSYKLDTASAVTTPGPFEITAGKNPTLVVTNAKNTGKAKVTKTVNLNGLPGLTGKTFTFKFGLFDSTVTPTKNNALETIDLDYVVGSPATYTKEFAYDLIPARNYVVRELDKDGNPLDGGDTIKAGDDDQQFRVEYGNVSGSTPVNYVTTYTYNVTNTALVSRGIITKILNDTDKAPLYTFFSFGVFDESDKQVGPDYEIEVKEVNGVWRGESQEIFLEHGKSYTVRELSAYKKDKDDNIVDVLTGAALEAVFEIPKPKSIPDDATSKEITHTWSFTATNTKKTASAEIIKELIVLGSKPIHEKFVFDLIAKDSSGKEWPEQKDIELTVTKDPKTGAWSASKTIHNLDPRYGYTFREQYETELKKEGFEINPVDRAVEGAGTNHIKYTCVITNSELGTRTAHARIQKILYTDYTNPQRDFSFNIMETKNGVTRVFGSYTLSVLQTASNRYENTSQLITGLDPDATYTIVEQNRQSLLNIGYTIREVASFTDVGTPVKNWTFTVTNTRYRSGGGGGGGSRLTRDGGGTTTIVDGNVPLSTITDTEVPLTTIPNSPIPLANLPVTGRRVAALLGSAGLILLGVTLKTRKKRYDD